MVRQAGLELTAETTQFVKKIREASRAASSLSKRFDAVKPSARKFGGSTKALVGGLSAMAAGVWASVKSVQALGTAFNTTRLEVDRMAQTSVRLGIAVKDIAALQLQARLAGLSVQTMEMALQRMTRRVAEAAVGTGEARNAIKELGLDAERLAAMNPAEQFAMITDRLRDLESQGHRVRLAMRFFDSEGVAVVQTLGLSIDDSRRLTEQFGTALNSVEVARIEQLNREIVIMQEGLRGLNRQVLADISPNLTEMVNSTSLLISVLTQALDLSGGVGGVFVKTTIVALKAFRSLVSIMSHVVRRFLGNIENMVRGVLDGASKAGAAVAEFLGVSFDTSAVDAFADGILMPVDALQKGNEKIKKLINASITVMVAQGKALDGANDKWRKLADDLDSDVPAALDKASEATKELTGSLASLAFTGGGHLKDIEAAILSAFDEKLEPAKDGLKELDRAAESFASSAGSSLGRFFESMQTGVESSKEATERLIKALAAAAIQAAGFAFGGPVGGAFIGSLAGPAIQGLQFAKGGILKAAKGTVIDSPTIVGQNPTTIGGEAGPEGVLPLERMQNGDLGVQASINLNMNISTPDADSFRRSSHQVASDMNRAIAGVFPGLGG